MQTETAAKYLRYLEKTLCNKDLAIKAFNAGSGRFRPFVDEHNCENISLEDFFAFRGKKIEEWYSHVEIRNGYTLRGIMKRRGIPRKNHLEILDLNGITNLDDFKVGQILHIPFKFAESFKTPQSMMENLEYIARYKAMIDVIKKGYPEFYNIPPSNGFGVHEINYRELEHMVKKGESSWKIAEQYIAKQYAEKGHGRLAKRIESINGKVLFIGEKVKIPPSTTLEDFALYNGHQLKDLMRLNPQIPDIHMELPDGAKIVFPLQKERAQQI